MMKKMIIAIAGVLLLCFSGCAKVSNSEIKTAETAIATSVTVATKTTAVTSTTKKETTVTTATTAEYLVYNEDSKRIHKNNCQYADSSMEKLDGNYIEYGRACVHCNPDVIIEKTYAEPVTTTVEKETEEVTYEVAVETYTVVAEESPKTSCSGCLTAAAGVFNGPSGKETYYNLNMSGCVSIMRGMGFDSTNYPVWTRNDGCKMFGDYIMCAASLDIRPRGSIVQSSLGACIVVDTGGFAYSNPTQLDIATAW